MFGPLQVVAGALVEGGDDEEWTPPGNAGNFINLELMLEEVRHTHTPPTPRKGAAA